MTIQTNVQFIADLAFYYCTALINVLDLKNVTSIGTAAFGGCQHLTHIEMPAGLTNLGPAAFSDCHSLSAVTIPPGIAAIPDNAFRNCLSLTSLMIPTNTLSVGSMTFFGCGSLTNLMIASGVTTIEDYAFVGCSFSHVTLPATVTNLGEVAFGGCNNLVEMLFQGNAPTAPSGSIPNQTAIYYEPGTAGWSGTLAFLPTFLWSPQLAIGSLGSYPQTFYLTLTGSTNMPVILEAADSLTGVWSSLLSCVLTNGNVRFADTTSSNDPSRFYRLRSP